MSWPLKLSNEEKKEAIATIKTQLLGDDDDDDDDVTRESNDWRSTQRKRNVRIAMFCRQALILAFLNGHKKSSCAV